jgi:predicted ATPase
MSEMSPVEPTEADPEPTNFEEPAASVRFRRLEMTNFLSYKSGVLEFGDFVALVGPNASGKSNAVSALKLLREISVYGLPTALARRGGFDQLRHRSAGRPYDPSLRITFAFPGRADSFYEIQLGAVKGGRYRVKRESAVVHFGDQRFTMLSNGEEVEWDDSEVAEAGVSRTFKVAPGQSALSNGGLAGYLVYDILRSLRTVEVNPAKVSDLQEPSSTREFEPDGSNAVSVYETLSPQGRRRLGEELATIVANIESIEVLRLADRQTLRFKQRTESGNREFYAKQMSDGTLRAFAILLAAQQSGRGLLVVEEPEIAIHLGALRTLVELLRARSPQVQVVITTHSADIVDALPIEDIRVVWTQGDASHIAPVSEHSKSTIRRGLITPGELLRSDSLDPTGI